MVATCLWFDGQTEEAITFYVAAFQKAGRAVSAGPVLRGDPAGPDGVLMVTDRHVGGALSTIPERSVNPRLHSGNLPFRHLRGPDGS
jgi:predicted 3-demethylubiquinone-9 3-methyltransferase (glyoxalase superfamily)